jgi:hypothetical protein
MAPGCDASAHPWKDVQFPQRTKVSLPYIVTTSKLTRD